MARRRYQRGDLQLYSGDREETWVLRWREDVVENGVQRRVRRSEVLGTLKDYPTRRLAMRAAEQRLAVVNSPTYRAKPTATFEQFSARWEAAVLDQLKPSTAINYRSHLKRHLVPFFGRHAVKDISAEMVQQFVAAVKASAKTKRNLVVTLQSMWRQARAWGYAAHDPFDGIVLPRARNVRRLFFTIEEIAKILHGALNQNGEEVAGAKEPYRTFYWLAAETGMRAGELCGLRVQDVDLERGMVAVKQSAWRGKVQDPKSARAVRWFNISPELVEHLRQHLHTWRPNVADLLFATRNGTPWDPNLLVKRRLHPLLDALEIPRAGLHAFRHANCTIMDQLGAPMRVRQERLGHSDPTLTLGTYTHLISSDDRRLAAQIGQLLAAKPKRGEILDGNGRKANQPVAAHAPQTGWIQ